MTDSYTRLRGGLIEISTVLAGYESLVLLAIIALLSWKYRIPYEILVWLGLAATLVAAVALAYAQTDGAGDAAEMAFNFLWIAVILATLRFLAETSRAKSSRPSKNDSG